MAVLQKSTFTVSVFENVAGDPIWSVKRTDNFGKTGEVRRMQTDDIIHPILGSNPLVVIANYLAEPEEWDAWKR